MALSDLTPNFEKAFLKWMEAQPPEVKAEAAQMLEKAKNGTLGFFAEERLSGYQERKDKKYPPKTSGDTPAKKKPATTPETKPAEAKPKAKAKAKAATPEAKSPADEPAKKPGTSKGLGKPKKKVKAETPDTQEKPAAKPAPQKESPAPKENNAVDREAQAKEAQAKTEKAEAKAKALQQKAWETQKNNALKWSEGQNPEVKKQTLAYIEKVNKGELTPRQFDQWQSKTIERIKGQTANMNKPAGDTAKPAAEAAKPAAESKAAPEGQPKTTNKAGYTVYETAKDAKAATPEGPLRKLGRAIKSAVTPSGYSPGQSVKEGVASATKASVRTPLGIAGTAVGAIEPVKAIYDAGQKGFDDPELNRRARRAAAVYAGQGTGAVIGGALAGTVASRTIAGVPLAVATGGAVGSQVLGGVAGKGYDLIDPPPVVEKLETKTQPTPVNQGRDWSPGELDSLMGTEEPVEELKQRQQDAVDQVPKNPIILEELRRAAEAGEQAGAARGPYVDPARNQDQDVEEILNPPNPEDSYRRILEMQDYARSNPAANLRKKRIMQAGLDAVETGTFRARRPDRYSIVV